MNYQQTLNFLYAQLPMFSKTGSSALKLGLNNIIALCNAINNPQQKIKTIHIAGTNGKGSVSNMLASILQHNGYKVGLYTSPHLVDFRERIKIDGSLISKAFVTNFIAENKAIIDEIKPSFFELTVAIAYDYFYRKKVDIAVIETGLGGRLDSTNIIIPQLSIITNISKDHVDILGNTVEKIAYEKAGIIKQNISVVIGNADDKKVRNVFIKTTKQNNSKIFFAEENYAVKNVEHTKKYLQLHITKTLTNKAFQVKLDLKGNYQTKNILTVLQSIDCLKNIGYNIKQKQTLYALKNVATTTGLRGRWEVLYRKKYTIIADVAHNEDGMKQVVEQLQKTLYKKLHIVFGMVKDKDINSVLKTMPKQATYYFSKASIARALNENELQQQAKKYNLNGNAFVDVKQAIEAAKNNAIKNDLILICGSIFLVGEAIENCFNTKQ